jgi:AraC family transcriptional regulator, regulatory protein of adaptative response / DNA-3-methyladenine glycosylase II
MELDGDTCYQALKTHDARFDGMYFVAVSSTGVYCRPVCRAKLPRRENCTFHQSAASAERAGYRPCLRCRPELAPGWSQVDATSRLAATALELIDDGVLSEIGVDALAARLGVTGRHLRRVVAEEFGLSPVEIAQTQRLLLAKQLLSDTSLPVGEVALASGFASLRRFNALFRERYRMSPSDLRRGRRTSAVSDTFSCGLGYRPPFDWDAMLRFLGERASAGTEMVNDILYARTVAIGEHSGWFAARAKHGECVLSVEVSTSLARTLPKLVSGMKRLFDLRADPVAIDARLGSLAADHPGLRVPGAFDGFELAVRAVIGQQVSVKAATTIAGRFTHAFGEPIETPFTELTHLPPTAERVARAGVAEIAELGVTIARARTIRALAEAVARGDIAFGAGANAEETMTRLRGLRGIGEWTVQYIAMRALTWPDAFPHTDLGVRKALGVHDPKRIMAMAEDWRPWRAYAVMHLWRSLKEDR